MGCRLVYYWDRTQPFNNISHMVGPALHDRESHRQQRVHLASFISHLFNSMQYKPRCKSSMHIHGGIPYSLNHFPATPHLDYDTGLGDPHPIRDQCLFFICPYMAIWIIQHHHVTCSGLPHNALHLPSKAKFFHHLTGSQGGAFGYSLGSERCLPNNRVACSRRTHAI